MIYIGYYYYVNACGVYTQNRMSGAGNLSVPCRHCGLRPAIPNEIVVEIAGRSPQ